jgi:hypothetical protein
MGQAECGMPSLDKIAFGLRSGFWAHEVFILLLLFSNNYLCNNCLINYLILENLWKITGKLSDDVFE